MVLITIKTIRRCVSAILATVMLLGLFGCAGGTKSRQLVAGETVSPRIEERSLHFSETDSFVEMSYSGLIMLLLDKSDYSVGVKVSETSKSTVWSSMPQDDSAASLPAEANILSMKVLFGGKTYLLNSQDDCVAFSNAFYTETENGFDVVYMITNEPEKIKNIDDGASEETYLAAASGSILFKATVSYSLKDGCLFASLKCKNLGSSSAVLESVAFLNYFGATEASAEGDFILVPDGSGALINTAKTGADFAAPSFAVYGNDLGGNVANSAVVPAYGMKTGESAFAVIIENGDALATISAHAASSESYNRVGAEFTITPSQKSGDKTYYSEDSYDGEILLCFRFFKSSNASYAGMAAVCREQLIRNYVLSTRSVEVTDYLPLCVELIGSADKGGAFGIDMKFTTYDEARDIVSRLKSKGINNIYLRYSGALSGGLQQSDLLDASLQHSLGGKKSFTELDNLMSGQKLMMFLDVDLLTMADSARHTAAALGGGSAVMNVTNVFAGSGFGVDSSEVHLRSIDKLEKTVLDVLNKYKNYQATGFCLADVGSILYSDFSAGLGRQEVSELILSEISPLSTQNMVMVDTGNFKTLKNADVVANLPMTSAIAESEAYTAVPFVQMILHGIVEYSPQGLNLEDDPKTAFLKCIEYGALPNFVWTNSLPKDNEAFATLFGYENWLQTALDDYTMANEALNDLRASRITGHFEVSDGIYCTEYEATTKIYVNYTDKVFSISGIDVKPMSYFRFN